MGSGFLLDTFSTTDRPLSFSVFSAGLLVMAAVVSTVSVLRTAAD